MRESDSVMGTLNYEIVNREYCINGKSDKDIANEFGITRTAVSHFRKRYGIETRNTTALEGHEEAAKFLAKNSYRFYDKRGKDGTSLFNFLVNRVVRIQVFSAVLGTNNKYNFFLTTRGKGDINTSKKYFVRVNDDCWRKDLSKSCDVVMFCAMSTKSKIYILPSNIIPIEREYICIPREVRQWGRWFENKKVIDQVLFKKTGGLEV